MALPSNANLSQYPAFLNARLYDAEFDRMVQQCWAASEGIAPFDQSKDSTISGMGLNRATDLEVTTGASGLNVSVAAGNAWVQGDGRATQGLYFCYVPTANTVTMPAANATNPRVDAVILCIDDADVSGSTSQWRVTYQQGTATAGATLANLTGAPGKSGGPALQSTAFVLAYVLTPATFAGPYVNATHILDNRYFAYRPGRIIGYKQVIADTACASGSFTTLVSMTVAGNGINRVMVDFTTTSARHTTAAGVSCGAYLFDGTTAGTIIRTAGFTSPGINYDVPFAINSEVGAFSGQKTLTAGAAPASGSLTVLASATSPGKLYARYV